MHPILVILPLVIVLAVLIYGIFRAFGSIWLEHRIRMALLQRLQEKPELVDSASALFDAIGAAEYRPERNRQDYAVTGVILAVLGAGFCTAGYIIRTGKLAVGIYGGGWACIILGLLLFIVGVAIRRLSRHPSFSPNRR